MEQEVRAVIELTYDGECRELKVTFDLIDKIRRKVPWEKMADEFQTNLDLAMIARFIYLNMIEAGFDDVSIDRIYDEINNPKIQESYITLAGKIVGAYYPRGKKKALKAVPKAAKKTKSRKKRA